MKSSIKTLFAILFAFLLIFPALGFADSGKHAAKGGHGKDTAAQKQFEEGSGSSAMEHKGDPADAAKAAMEEGSDTKEGEYKEHKGKDAAKAAMEEGSASKASPAAVPKKKEGSGM